jgi:MFS family permease
MHFIAAILVPFFTQWGRLEISEILFITAWGRVWVFILEIPTGTIADFFSRKLSLLLGAISLIISLGVYISYPSIYIFLSAEFICSVSYTFMSGASEALIFDSLKEINETAISKKVFSRMESFKLSGILVGSFLGGFIAKAGGLKAPFIGLIITAGISCLLILLLQEPTIHRESKKERYTAILLNGIKYCLQNRVLKILAIDLTIVFALSALILFLYQALLLELNVDIMVFGVIHTLMCIFQIAIIESSPWLERMLGGKKRVLFLSALIPGIGYLALGISKTVVIVVPLIIIISGFGMSRTPLFLSYLNQLIPSDKRATVLSTISMFRALVVFLVNISVGFVADWSISYVFLIVGGILTIYSLLSMIKEEYLVD